MGLYIVIGAVLAAGGLLYYTKTRLPASGSISSDSLPPRPRARRSSGAAMARFMPVQELEE